jgi:hypothetical protein
MVTPYVSFGEKVGVPSGSDPNSRIAIRYPTSHGVDPHGLSGCGLWAAENNLADDLWTPAISLIGLVTDWLNKINCWSVTVLRNWSSSSTRSASG